MPSPSLLALSHRMLSTGRRRSHRPLQTTHSLIATLLFDDGVPEETQQSTRRALRARITAGRREHAIDGNPDDVVHIRWLSYAGDESGFYCATSRFDDTYVRQLTQAVLHEAFVQVLVEMRLTPHQVQLDYLVVRNMESGRAGTVSARTLRTDNDIDVPVHPVPMRYGTPQ